MKKYLLALLFLFPSIAFAAAFNSAQVGSSPVNGYYLQTNGSVSTWAPVSGGGGSSGGTWSTTTSSVPGHLLNYSNNNTDIVLIGGTSTSTAKFIFDPNSTFGYISGSLGIGTKTPNFNLEVNGTASTSKLTGAGLATCNTGSFLQWASSLFGCSTAVTSITASSPLTGGTITSTGSIGIQAASASQNGYLAAADYSLLHSATTTFTSPLIYTNSTNAVTCQTASGSQAGCLASADWTTFNNKQTAGNYITALTGDVTASGPGSAAATLANVNSNTGSFGGVTSIPSFTVNAKGLITAASANTPSIPVGDITGVLPVSNGGIGVGTVTGCLTGNGTSAVTGSGTCNTTNATVSSVGLSSTNSTLTIGSTPVTTSGNITADLNLAHGNVWTASSTFTAGLTATIGTTTNATSTNFFSTTASSSNLFSASANFGALTINSLTGTQCLHEIAGVVSGTGSDCGAGGSTFAYPFTPGTFGSTNTSATSTAINDTAGLISTASSTLSLLTSVNATSTNATTTNVLNVGNGETVGSTAAPFVFGVLSNGQVSIGSSTPFAQFTIATTTNPVEPFIAIASSTGTTAATTTVYEIDQFGHQIWGGNAPTVSSCGTGSPTATGNDNVMTVTTGSGGATECTVTFYHAWNAVPVCTFDDQSNTMVTVDGSTTATTLKFGLSASLASANIGVICEGWQ